jgi:hypothetical protein
VLFRGIRLTEQSPERRAMAGLRAGVGDHSNRFMRDQVEEIDHQRLSARRPQFDEGRALEVAPEQRANARAGDPKWMPIGSVEGQNEA